MPGGFRKARWFPDSIYSHAVIPTEEFFKVVSSKVSVENQSVDGWLTGFIHFFKPDFVLK